jgi:hypothetical protein
MRIYHSERGEESLIINEIDFSLLLEMTLVQRLLKEISRCWCGYAGK